MTSPMPRPPSPDTFQIGDEVQVHAFAAWRPGKIVAFAADRGGERGKAKVLYVTGTGHPRTTAVRRHQLLPAGTTTPHAREGWNNAMARAAAFWGQADPAAPRHRMGAVEPLSNAAALGRAQGFIEYVVERATEAIEEGASGDERGVFEALIESGTRVLGEIEGAR